MSGIALFVPEGGFPHGTRARYVGGKCRCDECRRANREYARSRVGAVPNPLVDATEAREHLLRLSAAGIGKLSVAAASDVPCCIVSQVKMGRKTRIRAATARRLLSVDATALADHALLPGGPTRAALRELRRLGLTKTAIASRLGSAAKRPALQLTQPKVTAKNALKVTRLLAAVRVQVAAERAARPCPRCGESHGQSRLEVLRGLSSDDVADLPRMWPCLYGGARGAELLASDLKRIAEVAA